MKRTMTKHLHHIALSAVLIGFTAAASAHEGHGLPGSAHWHSTDTIGYLLLAAIGATLWFTRKK